MSYIGNIPPARASAGVEEPNYFFNYSDITSDSTTSVTTGRNGFIKGAVTVAAGVTWTIDGILTIL
jgi:hypothetical protein